MQLISVVARLPFKLSHKLNLPETTFIPPKNGLIRCELIIKLPLGTRTRLELKRHRKQIIRCMVEV